MNATYFYKDGTEVVASSVSEANRKHEEIKNMKNLELANKIFDYISDGYDDEEQREEVVNALCDELSRDENKYIKISFHALCERIEELEEK